MEGALTHDIKQIFECRNDNYKLPKELEKYCVNKVPYNKSQREHMLIKIMSDITSALRAGVDPNNTTFMNAIRGELNKVNATNYENVIAMLKSLNYAHETNFEMLAKELIVKSMNDSIATKWMEGGGDLYPSDIYTNIISEFSSFFIQDGERVIKFKTIVARMCQYYFKELTNTEMKMDKNNQHRVNNFKGYMNMIGLLYYKKCFSKDVVINCLTKITDIIKSNISVEESDNYYSGYERLLNQVLRKYENDTQKEYSDEFGQIYGQLCAFNNTLTSVSQKIRRFSCMIHEQNIARLADLQKRYAS